MTIEFASEHNKVGNVRVVLPQFLPWFETSEGLVFIDAFEFQSNGVLPEGVSIGLVEFQGVFHIARDFHAEHELDSIDACLVSVHHQGHLFVILEEFGGPLPCGVLG